jgi:hypothetical protein
LHTVPKQELVPISIDHPQNSANQVLSSRMRQHSAEERTKQRKQFGQQPRRWEYQTAVIQSTGSSTGQPD